VPAPRIRYWVLDVGVVEALGEVRHVPPEGIPLVLLVPDLGPLEHGDLELHVALEDLLEGLDVGVREPAISVSGF